METIYDWLLHNTGNEGNYYTILNPQRNGIDSLDVMARTKNFDVVNLLIRNTQYTDLSATGSTEAPGRGQAGEYNFGDEQQVINFLAEGKTPDSQTAGTGNGIHVLVTEPVGNAGDVTFPPAQA